MDAAQKLMSQFRSLVKAKGWTVDELHDILVRGAMHHCQPSPSAVAKWMSGDRLPNTVHTLAILEFIQTHPKDGIQKKK